MIETTIDNYFDGTTGIWVEINKLPEGAEFIRNSYNKKTGECTSSYWKYKDCIIRQSNHWGKQIAIGFFLITLCLLKLLVGGDKGRSVLAITYVKTR